MYADAENLITAWLRTQTGKSAGNEAPSNLTTDFIRVQRVPGTGTRSLGIDRATLEVDYFGQSRGSATDGAVEIRDLMENELPKQVLDGHAVLQVETQSAPAWLPWNNTNVRRIHATYVVTLH